MSIAVASDPPIRPDYLLKSYARFATLAGPRLVESERWPDPPQSARAAAASRKMEAFVAYLSRPTPPSAIPFANADEAAESGRQFVDRVRTTLDSLQGLRSALDRATVGVPDEGRARRLLAEEAAIVGMLTADARTGFEVMGTLTEREPDGFRMGAFALTVRGAGFAVRIGSDAVPLVARGDGVFRPLSQGAGGRAGPGGVPG